MPKRTRVFPIPRALAAPAVLLSMGALAAQSVQEAYECSMECHRIAQFVYDERQEIGGWTEAEANELAWDLYDHCVRNDCG